MPERRLKAVGVIPVRYDSTRLPGKALAEIAGKPMVQHVYERSAACERLDGLYIATDDRRIYDVARRFTDDVLMTSPDHKTGTDRVAEVAEKVEGDVFVNIQGDEPLIEPAALEAVIKPLDEDPSVVMATAARPAETAEEVSSPDTCKLAVDLRGRVMYSSRSPVPYARPGRRARYLIHVGLYAYRADFLREFTSLGPAPLEEAEGLEMLRALEHGFHIRVVVGGFTSLGVDTAEDLARVRNFFKKMS